MPVIPGIIILSIVIVLAIVGIILERFFLGKKQKPAFFNELKRLADEGTLQARYVLAKSYPKYIENHFQYMTETAAEGHGDAQAVLAYHYFKRRTLWKNARQAFKWATQATEQGSVSAQYLLYQIYLNGVGIEKDVLQAYHWLLVALQEPARKQRLLPQEDILKFQKATDHKIKALWRLHLEDWATYREEMQLQKSIKQQKLLEKIESNLSADEKDTIQCIVKQRSVAN